MAHTDSTSIEQAAINSRSRAGRGSQPGVAGKGMRWAGSMYQAGGVAVIALAVAVYASRRDVNEIIDWTWQVFGPVFIGGFTLLVVVSVHCLAKIKNPTQSEHQRMVAFEVGSHAAAGVATLALTFTLLGISLGIGSLAEQSLTPDTVTEVISGLTRNFATAFMTTVVGLPTAAILRALLAVARVQKVAS